MKSQSGVTLATLTIYVIVAGIVVIILAFLNANFFSQMSDLTNKTEVTNQYARFASFFVKDLKASKMVDEYNSNEVTFRNGAKYEIRKSENEEKYVIYRDSIKICENIVPKYFYVEETDDYVKSPCFDYDHLENTVTAFLVFARKDANDKNIFESTQVYKVGKGY